MANGTKGALKTGAPAAPSPSPAPASLVTAPAQPAANRKKQKRRQKAKAGQQPASSQGASAGQLPLSPDLEEEDPDETDSDDGFSPIPATNPNVNGHMETTSSSKKKNKKKKKNKGNAQPADEWGAYDTRPPMPHMGHSHSSYSFHHSNGKDRIWNTSSHEERERIKDFWRSLGETDRKSLLKVEKDTVIKTMKEQQKHSCSCTVCGRKRHAIEEELEVLYDAYYNEIEQYALDQAKNGSSELPYSMDISHTSGKSRALARTSSQNMPPPSIQQASDDEEYDDEDYDDEDIDSADFSADDEEGRHPVAADLRIFGNSLEIEGNMLTVADDLLRNDGKKFIDMMEQLAERRIQQEEDAQYSSQRRDYYGDHDGLEDDEDDYDDEEYDEDYDDEEEEEEAMTNDQRMEEGRRMFQIFAARLFEQRVLNAYRQKVADERQKKLLEELEEEKTNDVQREAKKQRDAQKKKEKKERLKQAKAEEKARKDAEKVAAEAAAKAAEAAKLEEQRKRKEEIRKKKETERKAQEEEKQKKELERLRRLQEERERQQESERKAREAKAQEKKAREEAKRKEREEREAKEREVRERKAHVERQRRDIDDQKLKAKTDKDTQERVEKERAEKAKRDVIAAQAAQAVQANARRVAQTATVAIPPGLPRSTSGLSSPHVPVAAPAIPKAPTPVRARPGSRSDSKTSSPQTPQIPTGPAKSMSPLDAQPSVQPPVGQIRKITMPKMSPMTQSMPLSAPAHGSAIPQGMASIQPPPGMNAPPGFGMQSPLNGYPQSPGTSIPSANRTPNPNAFLQHAATAGAYRPQGPPLSGVTAPGVPGMTRMFSDQGVPPVGSSHPPPGFGVPLSHSGSQHGRQASGSSTSFEAHAPGSQAPQRPAPIQRPSSVKPLEHEGKIAGLDIDDLSNHLGSSALLDDSDEPIPGGMGRLPGLGALGRGSSNISEFGMFPQPGNAQRMDSFGLQGSSNPSSTWSTPPSNLGFGATGPAMSPAAASSWTSPATAGWPATTAPKNPFGMNLHHNAGPHSRPSALQIRISIVGIFRTVAAHPHSNLLPISADGFVEVAELMRHIDIKVTAREILDLCDTEGNIHNGDGNFTLRTNPQAPERSLVRWEPPEYEKSTPIPPPGIGNSMGSGALGEIGSPGVGTSLPAHATVMQSPPGLFPGLGSFH